MPFIVPINNLGIIECPCCRDFLHHCRKCWNEYHNGERDNDYIPPKYYGQCILRDEVMEIFKGKIIIQEDNNRAYKEGEYH